MTNLRNPQTYQDSFWDWTFLNKCFEPTRIKVSDIDGIVERKGRFLLIETKYPGQPIEDGQKILHDAALRTGRFSVLVIWGKPNNPVKFVFREFGRPDLEMSSDSDTIAAIVRGWFERVNK